MRKIKLSKQDVSRLIDIIRTIETDHIKHLVRISGKRRRRQWAEDVFVFLNFDR
ncbi:MAG: hypothetical protein HRU19_18040 [Pseudobacteriovorax sp.]|nr:hypothetical protein [Pseudobacteriovorax sp.]